MGVLADGAETEAVDEMDRAKVVLREICDSVMQKVLMAHRPPKMKSEGRRRVRLGRSSNRSGSVQRRYGGRRHGTCLACGRSCECSGDHAGRRRGRQPHLGSYGVGVGDGSGIGCWK